MRCGLPVVATTVNSVPDLVAPGETGLLVPPAHPIALACAIVHLLDHPAVADRLASAGQEAIDSRFDSAELGQVLDQAFTEHLAANRWAVGA
jgi:glycosyltransferase involved in cell wall biosynthesis